MWPTSCSGVSMGRRPGWGQGRGGSAGQELAAGGPGEGGFLQGPLTPRSPGGADWGPWRPAMTQPVRAGVGTACCLLCTHTRGWRLSLPGPSPSEMSFTALPGFPECGEGQRGAAARVWPVGRCLASASPAALTGVQELGGHSDSQRPWGRASPADRRHPAPLCPPKLGRTTSAPECPSLASWSLLDPVAPIGDLTWRPPASVVLAQGL